VEKRNIFIFALIFVLVFSSFCTFYLILNIPGGKPPDPEVFSYGSDYYKGGFYFDLAKTSRDHEVEYSFLVFMNSDGEITNYKSDLLAYHDYPNLLSENQIFYKISGRKENPHLIQLYVWNFETDKITEVFPDVNTNGHHELLIEDNYFITLRRAEKGGLDTIERINLDNSSELLFSTEDLFNEPPCPGCQRPNDWLHANDVTKSLDGEYYFLNMRAANSIAKIHIETGELIWILGMNGNFTLIEDGIEKESLWYHSHIIKEIEPNVFLMFDNDLHNSSKTYPEFKGWYDSAYGGESRLIKFSVNEDLMEAEITWSYSPGENYYGSGFGDIDLLPNGNILGTFGIPIHDKDSAGNPTGDPFGAAILEVSPSGDLIREYRFPFEYAIYRLQLLTEDFPYPGSWILNYLPE